jgi:RNA polymerase sigma-70 factor, ECF subfamily
VAQIVQSQRPDPAGSAERTEGPSDSELVSRTLAGSERAFHDLVLRYERPIFSLIVRMVRDANLAEDLAQEVFLKAYRRLDTFDRERRFASWLFKIAHNATLDHLRKSGLDTVPLEGSGDDEPGLVGILADDSREGGEARVHRGDLARVLESALASLKPEHREALMLRFKQGLAYQEICDVMGLPLGTVKTNIHRARKSLAEALTRAGFRAPE